MPYDRHMPGVAPSSLHDAQDAEDRRLLEAGEVDALVEAYWGVIVRRCTLRLGADAGADAAAEVVLRLLRELRAGKTYSAVPFRVVVHKVIEWKVLEHLSGGPDELPLADWDAPVEGAQSEVDDRSAFDWLLHELTATERRVVELRWWYGRSPQQIADALGMTRNAVDQRLHHAHRRIRTRLEGGGA